MCASVAPFLKSKRLYRGFLFPFSRDCKFAFGIDLSLSHNLHLITVVHIVVVDKCLLNTY